MLHRFILLFSILLCVAQHAVASDDLTVESEAPDSLEDAGFSISFQGFVKTDYWVDSRTVVAAREDLFLLYPSRERLDEKGRDIHGDPVFNFSAITSRVATHITGPDAFGAKVSGVIEADFSGVTDADINGFRLRHAYLNLSWERWDLLLGQWWHPMFSAAVLPDVVSLNTGAPFQPFIRNPQASLTYHHGQSSWIISMIGQRDNASDGPHGASPDYLRHTTIPNFHLQWTRNHQHLTTGLAADYKVIRPRMETEGVLEDDASLYTDEQIATYAFMAFGGFSRGKLNLKAKTIYGQNLSEHLMLGGYAEKEIDDDGFVRYTPLNHLSSWFNMVYGERLRGGLYLGYARNLGASDDVEGRYYGRGSDIAYLYRISPSLRFASGNVELCAELEYTAAAYGETDRRGRVKDYQEVGNTRLLFTAFYYF